MNCGGRSRNAQLPPPPPNRRSSLLWAPFALTLAVGSVLADEERREVIRPVEVIVDEVRCCVTDQNCPLTRLAECRAPIAAPPPPPAETFEFQLDEQEGRDQGMVLNRGSRADRIRFLALLPEVERVVVVQPYGVTTITAPDGTQDTLCLAVTLETLKGAHLPGAEFVTAGGPAPGAARTSHAPVCIVGVAQLVVLGRVVGWSAPLAMGSDEETVVADTAERLALLERAKGTLRAALGGGR